MIPYDPERMTLFGTLHARLAAERFLELPRPQPNELENRAFWEAYFSNFIEGTKFTVEEARVIVYDREAAKALENKRPDDAHDILETYRLIVDPKISSEVPKDKTHLLELLRRRHARMMASRSAIDPGVFKTPPQPIRFPHVRRSGLGSRNSGAWLASQLRPVFTHRSRPLRPFSDR